MLKKYIAQKYINLFFHLPKAVAANLIYRFPSRELTVIGVTGTDGKTTTSSLIHHILQENKKSSALVSSVEAKYGGKTIPTGLHVTSPSPFFLQKLIRDIVGKGIKYLVLETTSHGLDQYRVWGVRYKIAVLTNVSNEHLDYHKNYKNYLQSKFSLLRSASCAVINADDKSYGLIKSLIAKNPGRIKKTISYGKKGTINLSSFPFTSRLPGEYNQENCLAAAAVCLQLGLPAKGIAKAIAGFKGVEGRMDFIENNRGVKIVVDFAHTPNALENAIETLKSKNRLISIFGCAGLRDFYKRPAMGFISGTLSDISIITAEDPRSEDLALINRQIEEGLKKAGASCKSKDAKLKLDELKKGGSYYFIIPDRWEAINFAINKLSEKGDIIALFGKGHEKSLCIGTREYPWSDHEAVKKALEIK